MRSARLTTSMAVYLAALASATIVIASALPVVAAEAVQASYDTPIEADCVSDSVVLGFNGSGEGAYDAGRTIEAFATNFRDRSLAAQRTSQFVLIPYPALAVPLPPDGLPTEQQIQQYRQSIHTGVERGLKGVRARLQVCPGQEIVLVGYSQGALVIRELLEELTVDELAKVSSVALIADPARYGESGSNFGTASPLFDGIAVGALTDFSFNGGLAAELPSAVRPRVVSWCDVLDPVCEHRGLLSTIPLALLQQHQSNYYQPKTATQIAQNAVSNLTTFPAGDQKWSPSHWCGGRPATIIGTPGNDLIEGTPGDDVIAGLQGDDTISGLGGDDVLCGGKGNDMLVGGQGFDILYGAQGDDTLVSSDGVEPSERVDVRGARMFGGEGFDFLFGSNRWDRMQGGPGSDTILGYEGRDWLRGGPGSDSLDGGDGIDNMYGANGWDWLFLTSGDTARGGAGRDRCDFHYQTAEFVRSCDDGVWEPDPASGRYDDMSASFDPVVFIARALNGSDLSPWIATEWISEDGDTGIFPKDHLSQERTDLERVGNENPNATLAPDHARTRGGSPPGCSPTHGVDCTIFLTVGDETYRIGIQAQDGVTGVYFPDGLPSTAGLVLDGDIIRVTD